MNDQVDMKKRGFGKLAIGAGLAGAAFAHGAFAQETMPPEFRNIRRRERALTEEQAWLILDKGVYGVLATVDKSSQSHGTPISYAVDKERGYIFFHGASSGQKIDNMKQNPRVCFTVVGEAEPIFIHDPFDYSVYFASTMAYGEVEVLSGDEKKMSLLTIVKKYFPENVKGADEYYDKFGPLIDVWKIKVNRITAKAHERGTKIEVPTS